MLPVPLRAFWSALFELSPICRRAPWGAVVADPSCPDVWDANNASVLESRPGLRAEEVRAALLPVLREAGATHEHIEVWGARRDLPLVGELTAAGGRRDPDVEMVLLGPPADPPRHVEVREMTDPDAGFLAWYRASKNEFGERLHEDVLDQLLERDLRIFLPAGLRWFVGHLDGERAGYTTVLGLQGAAYLDAVVTMPPFRGRGVATATVLTAARASLQAENALVHLLAGEREPPRRLYERLGFRTVGRVESFTRPMQPA